MENKNLYFSVNNNSTSPELIANTEMKGKLKYKNSKLPKQR